LGSEERFLEYNRSNIFTNLLQLEDHLRNLDPSVGVDAEFLSCCSKHLAITEGECREAQSHCLVVEGKDCSARYKIIGDAARDLRKKIQEGGVDPDDAILEARRIRHIFEEANPKFDTSKCASCGKLDSEGVEKIRALQAEYEGPRRLQILEEGMAHAVLEKASKDNGVEPPELIIDPSCHDPEKGLYKDGKILLCRSGVSEHLILHEFKHYLQHREGKPLDEDEAERFAVDSVASHSPHNDKGLNSKYAEHNSRENKLPISQHVKSQIKQVGMVYAASAVGTVSEPINNYLDATYGGKIFGYSPSLVMDVGVPALIAAVEAYSKSPKMRKWDIPLAVIGGGFVNDGIRRYIFPRIPGLPTRAITRVISAGVPTRAVNSTMLRPSVRVTPTNGPLASSPGSKGKFAVVSA